MGDSNPLCWESLASQPLMGWVLLGDGDRLWKVHDSTLPPSFPPVFFLVCHPIACLLQGHKSSAITGTTVLFSSLSYDRPPTGASELVGRQRATASVIPQQTPSLSLPAGNVRPPLVVLPYTGRCKTHGGEETPSPLRGIQILSQPGRLSLCSVVEYP